MKTKILSLLTAGLITLGGLTQAKASEIQIDIYGMSYHFKKSEAYHNAPRGWNDGQYVYNPGVGIEYDFRNKGEDGFSPIVMAGWFQDCADYPFYYLGGGARYKHYIGGSNWFVDTTLAGGVANAEDWDIGDDGYAVSYGRVTTFLPIANVGVGYKFKNGHYLKYTVTYVPQNDDAGGTSGTDLLFMWLSYGF